MRRNLALSRKRQGVVLFMVVAIVLMMTLLTYAFLLSMRTQNLASSQAGDQLQARQAAFSARELVCGYLEDSLAQRHALGGLQNNENLFREINLQIQGEEVDEFTPRGLVLANLNERRFGIRNESAKINLKKLLELDTANPGWGRDCLMRVPQMTETMADQILDWMDEDDEPREFGAESEFYLEEYSYSPRNSVPPTLEELTRIPDVTGRLLFGVDSEQGRTGDLLGLEESMRPWSDFLTVRSAERNENYEGNRRINLNSSDLFELHTLLVELVNIETANFVVLARQFGLITLVSEPVDSSRSKSPSEIPVDFTVEATFEFQSVLDVIGGIIKIGDESDDPDNVTFVKSPFPENAIFDDLLRAFLDSTDIGDAKVLEGRVNIMLAPLEVLQSIPAIDDELAAQILANRDSIKNSAKNCFWLLENRLVNMEQMKALSPHVTVRGEVCGFVYAGWSHSSLAPVAFHAIVDGTGTSTRLVFNEKILDTKSLTLSLASSEQDR